MAKQFIYSINPEVHIDDISQMFMERLHAHGYNVFPIFNNDLVVSLKIEKSGSDLEKFAGMIPEFNLTLNKTNNSLFINIDSIWTNIIIALVFGWVICGIGFITGLIGLSKQSSASNEIQQILLSTVQEFN